MDHDYCFYCYESYKNYFFQQLKQVQENTLNCMIFASTMATVLWAIVRGQFTTPTNEDADYKPKQAHPVSNNRFADNL